jgi:hypothetical protein
LVAASVGSGKQVERVGSTLSSAVSLSSTVIIIEVKEDPILQIYISLNNTKNCRSIIMLKNNIVFSFEFYGYAKGATNVSLGLGANLKIENLEHWLKFCFVCILWGSNYSIGPYIFNEIKEKSELY